MTISLIEIGAETIAADFIRSPPSAVVTAPAGTVSSTSTSVTWTYTSIVSHAQTQYRVQLRNNDGSLTFYDSGNVVSAAVTLAVPYLLSSGTTYVAVVTVFDGFDWSDEATTTFTVDLADVNDYPDNEAVGSVYEIAINGTGYMLADYPEKGIAKDLRYRRETIPLDAPRFATSETPFSESLDRYTFIGFSDFTAGSGQRLKDREASVANAFYDSESVDPFTSGELRLLPTSADMGTGSAGILKMCVASDLLFVVVGAKALKSHSTLGGAATSFSVAAAGTISDMTSDGANWYVTDGVNVFRGATAADPGAAWSTVDTNLMEWCTDRLCVATVSTGSTPNQLETYTPAGAQETIVKTLASGTTIRSITSGDGYVWFAADRFDKSTIYAWQLGAAAGTAFASFELPQGQTCMEIGYYQGNLFVRARELTGASTARAIIYRCVASEGKLIPSRLLDFENDSLDHSLGCFAGDDRYVAFTWASMSSANKSGFAVVDLSTGGYAKWLFATTAGAPVNILSWKGRWVYSITAEGVLYETSTAAATGYVRTSITDLASQLSKVIDEVRVSVDPLPSNSTVAVSYSLDGGTTYTALGSLSTAGSKAATMPVGVSTDTVGLQVTLSTTGSTPVLKAAILKLHPLGISDQVVVLPINCSSMVSGMNGRPLRDEGSPSSGSVRARALEELMGSRVKFQDIDWAKTRSSSVWEVTGVEVQSVGVFGRGQNRQDQSQITLVTLRRGFR